MTFIGGLRLESKSSSFIEPIYICLGHQFIYNLFIYYFIQAIIRIIQWHAVDDVIVMVDFIDELINTGVPWDSLPKKFSITWRHMHLILRWLEIWTVQFLVNFWRPSSISMQPSNRLLRWFQKVPRWTNRNKSHCIGLVLFGWVIWERISKLRYVSQKWISWVMTWTHLSQNICNRKLKFWITCKQIILIGYRHLLDRITLRSYHHGSFYFMDRISIWIV